MENIAKICISKNTVLQHCAIDSRTKMAVLYYVGVVALLFLLYCLVRLVQLLLSDCNLKLRSCSLNSEYFQQKVVWLVGASGGSKYLATLVTK